MTTPQRKRARTVSYGLRQRAWWVMRRRKNFTLTELLNIVADGMQKDATSNLGKYCRALARAGILQTAAQRRAGEALTSNGFLEYRLIVDSGRKNPVWRESAQEVYDPNTGVIYKTHTLEAEVTNA